jgi:hypothetical protein
LAEYQPATSVARHTSQKLWMEAPQAHSSADAKATASPIAKLTRRPNRRWVQATGAVQIAAPTT